MIDLHTHTLLSDGELLPSELARRAETKGYRYLGLTDHVDASNLDLVIPRLVQVAKELNHYTKVRVIPGAELTHVPPSAIAAMILAARRLGAAYIVVHGETPVEPVEPGTNRAAIEGGADILAHPGQIKLEDVELAKIKGVLLEITTRRGHSLTNGHVARLARRCGAALILNTDTHAPADLVDLTFARQVALGAGLADEDFEKMRAAAENLVLRVL
ncbi:MAG: histidinol phosphate phosphatase domain-containing protein [Deltaproteobacteria bacterium]|nr:histidinol phosphate phosphatase domain-containing protein [Deltaproteobacteria bacterium]